MANRMYPFKFIALAVCLAAASGCMAAGGMPEAQHQQSEGRQGQAGPGLAELARTPTEPQQSDASSVPGELQAFGADNAAIRMKAVDNAYYVPLRELAEVLQFTTAWDAKTQTFRMGDYDAPYSFTINSQQALKNGDAITLPAAPRLEGETIFIPASAIADLFREEMSYELRNDRLIVRSSNVKVLTDMNAPDPEQADDGLRFADDPKEPFTEPLPETELPVWVKAVPDGGEAAAAVAARTIDMDALVRKGMQYEGVKYEFGADPYPKSGRFDCSAYTQYLFGKFGVSLPRLARQQAQRGTTVSRTSLRKGDLMFFCVPGRFRSNRTVGHVGIYLGGYRMLHASPRPKDGVQITSLDNAYWKEAFLFAKRTAY